MLVSKCADLPVRKLTPHDVGIEVELEGDYLPQKDFMMWRVAYDGSLAHGRSAEYVLKHPMKLEESFHAVDLLEQKLNSSKLLCSVRCGVHVHINVQSLTLVQLYNYITLYSMFEEALLSFCGKGRVGNLFCVPLNKSKYLIRTLAKLARRGNKMDLLSLYSDDIRYCAINFKAICEYGSLEFRALASGDFQRIKSWVEILYILREQAKLYNNPEEIMEEAINTGLVRFYRSKIPKSEYGGCYNLKNKLIRSFNETLQIAYACDWEDTFNDELQTKISTKSHEALDAVKPVVNPRLQVDLQDFLWKLDDNIFE